MRHILHCFKKDTEGREDGILLALAFITLAITPLAIEIRQLLLIKASPNTAQTPKRAVKVRRPCRARARAPRATPTV